MAARNAKRSISTILRTVNSLMTPWLSGHFSIFVLVFLVLKSFLGIARQWSQQKFAILTLRQEYPTEPLDKIPALHTEIELAGKNYIG